MNSQKKVIGIFSTSFFGWATIALLKGLGGVHFRSSEGELVRFSKELRVIFEGWEPSKDGSRLTDWEDLGDPGSPHYRRRYLKVFAFQVKSKFYIKKNTHVGYCERTELHENVVAFSCSAHQDDELHEIVGLSSADDWDRLVESRPEGDDSGVTEWLRANEVKLR